ncbi:hypothetical protein Tco_0974434 [Tanacetum coccineum]|uniref:CCHC-type domain-containing protein n=1 Tax=Tanacetum coccineum TaxID=301880 RepID=A0ABQ5EBN0_9ASTR
MISIECHRIVKQDPDGVKYSQDPPQIDHNCCYECGDSLDGIFCQQCICKFCGKGAHYGYNCPPKVPIISNPEQCNQTINELPQILPNENSFIYNSKPHSFNVSPSVLTYPPQLQFETYLCELCGNNAHYGYDCSPQFPFSLLLMNKSQSDEVIKSSVENLVSLPSELELEEVNDVDQEEKEFNLEDIFQIQDVILREKLLNVHRLISNIKSLKVNSTPDRVLESPSPFPIPVVDSDAFFEESNTSLSHSNNSLPEFESFSDQMEETRIGSANYSLPEFESFHFDNPSFSRPPPEPPDVEICLHFKPDAPVIDNFNELNDDQRGSEIDFSQNVEDDDSFTFVIRTFLPFLTYPEASLLSCSTGSEDTIFNPCIST